MKLFKLAVLGVVVAVIVGLVLFTPGQLMSYRPGWEISAENVAWGLRAGDGTIQNRTLAAGATIQWDADNPEYGYPDVISRVGDVREETLPSGYSPGQDVFDKGNFKYIVEYHEYLFDVQIQTLATVTLYKLGIFGDNYWRHETAMPYSYRDNLGASGSDVGKSFVGVVYVRFSNLPWGTLDYGPVPENYTFKGYWLGVMNAKSQKVERGQVDPEATASWQGWARGLESPGAQLNIFRDDGSFGQAYVPVPRDQNKVLDPDIADVVIVELPFDVLAGAYEIFSGSAATFKGQITEVKPRDWFITYTVRMECLVVKEYEYADPGISPNPSPIEHPVDYVPGDLPSWIDQYLIWIIIAIVIVIVFLVLLGPWLGISFFYIVRALTRLANPYPGILRLEGVKWHE